MALQSDPPEHIAGPVLLNPAIQVRRWIPQPVDSAWKGQAYLVRLEIVVHRGIRRSLAPSHREGCESPSANHPDVGPGEISDAGHQPGFYRAENNQHQLGWE